MTYRKLMMALDSVFASERRYRLDKLETRRYTTGNYDVVLVSRKAKLAGRPTVCLVGSLHGDEPVGAHVLSYHLVEIFEAAEKSKVNLKIVPCGNPYGLDRRTKYTPKNKRTNGGFIHPEMGRLSPENHKFRRMLRETKAEYYLDLHEDKDMTGAYAYAFKDRKIAARLLKALTKIIPLEPEPWMDDPDFKDKEIDLHDGIIFEMHDGTSEDFMSHQPWCRFAGATETPSSKFPIQVRARAQADAVLELIRIAARQAL